MPLPRSRAELIIACSRRSEVKTANTNEFVNKKPKRQTLVVIFVALSDQLPKSVVVAIVLVDIAALLNYFCIITYALAMYPVNIFQRRRYVAVIRKHYTEHPCWALPSFAF